MPPENPNQNGTGNTPQGTANTPGTDNQQAQEPAWLQYLPQEHRESAKKDYLLQSDYTKKTTEYAEKQKSWEKEKSDWEAKAKYWDEFNSQYQPFREKLAANWDKIQAVLNGQQLPQQQQQNPQPQDLQNYFENYDVLPPAEQARRLAEFSHQQHFVPHFNNWLNQFNQAVTKREQYYQNQLAQNQNYLKILTKALTQKIANPALDIDAYMARANEINSGKVDPLDIAYNDVTSEASKKAIEEAAYKQARADFELEQQNKQQSSGAFNSEMIPLFKQKPLTRDQVTEAARQVAAKKNLAW